MRSRKYLIILTACFWLGAVRTTWGIVWDQALHVEPWDPQEKALTYWINDTEIRSVQGVSAAGLEDLRNQHRRKIEAGGQGFASILGNHLVSCHLARGPHATQSPVDFLKALQGSCLYAQQKQRQTKYQRIDLIGLPLPLSAQSPQALAAFETFGVEPTGSGKVFTLQSSAANGLQILIVRSGAAPDAFSRMQAKWQADGWQLLDRQPNQTFWHRQGRTLHSLRHGQVVALVLEAKT